MVEYAIDVIWDSEASVWVATSEDIAGLVLESGSIDALIERVRYAAPELLAFNGNKGKICHSSSDQNDTRSLRFNG